MAASEPLSLYFGTEEGEQASLETIARASLAWTDGIKQLAARIDPQIEIRIEFEQTEPGSVWVQSVIKAIGRGDEQAVKAVIVGALGFFALGLAEHGRDHAIESALRLVSHEDETDQTINEERAKQIAEEAARNVIREVERDAAISSVGTSQVPTPGMPPERLIERYRFPEFGAGPVIEDAPAVLTDVDYEFDNPVTIVKETLKFNSRGKIRWRFEDLNGVEFSADIDDEEFLLALERKQTGLETGFGVRMVVDVAIDKRFVDGKWVVSNRRIIRVNLPAIDRRQGALGLENN